MHYMLNIYSYEKLLLIHKQLCSYSEKRWSQIFLSYKLI